MMGSGTRLKQAYVEQQYLTKNVRVLSAYVNQDTRLQLECLTCGKTWTASFAHGARGCKVCSRNRLTQERVEQEYRKTGITVESTYQNMLTPLKLRCDKTGVRWEAKFRYHPQCPCCSGNAGRHNEASINAKLQRKGYTLASPYKGSAVKHKIKCLSCGVERNSGLDKLPKCSECHTGKYTEAFVMAKYADGGIKLLSKYRKTHGRNQLECVVCGHCWEAIFSNFFSLGIGCPQCADKYERRCRDAAEDVLGFRLPKVKHPLIRNPETNRMLELDGFNEQHKVAFEYQGVQHYEKVPSSHPMFAGNKVEELKQRDAVKAARCAELGIRLIVVPYWVLSAELRPFIQNECNTLGIGSY